MATYKCIPVEHGIEIATSPVTFFTYRIAAHKITDLGNNRLRITRLIDDGVEIYDEPVTAFLNLNGDVIATTFADFITFVHTDIAKLRAGVGTAVANNVIDLLIGGPNTLGGYKVGTGLMVDGDGRLSASASNEETKILATEEEMLALTTNVTQSYRVIRTDTARLYYLNANDSPAVLENWIVGPSIEAAVNSFNMRTGDVRPENGDYTLDMVPLIDKTTESANTLVLVDGKLAVQNSLGDRAELAFSTDTETADQISTLESKVSASEINVTNLQGSDNRQNIAIDELKNKDIVHDTRLTAIDAALLAKAPLVDGKIPYSALPQLPTGRKVNVANRAGRLALSVYTDLTIAYESDTGNAYALNANENPAISSNWSMLGNAQAIGVASFNGRTGNIGPQTNDYNTSQIAETVGKRFLTPEDVEKWDAAPSPSMVDTKIATQKTADDLVYETKQHASDTFLTKLARAVANGVAPLDASSRVPSANLPIFLPQRKRVWHDVKADRSVGVWVTNTSQNEMEVHIRASLAGAPANRFVSILVRENASGPSFVFNATVLTNVGTGGLTYADANTVSVPTGWQYQLSTTGGSTDALTERWYEMY